MDALQFRKNMVSEQVRHNDIMSTRAQHTVLDGRFGVNNTGEAYKDIVFPVAYADMPTLTFGFEVDSLNSIIITRAPVITAEVYDWIYIERLPLSRLYTGARILVVSTGATVSKFTVTWSASGTAFTNPRS